MAKLKLVTTPFSTTYAKTWTKPRANERRNSLEYLGL